MTNVTISGSDKRALAVSLLAAADALGLPRSVVRVSLGRFVVPEEVAEAAELATSAETEEPEEIEEAVSDDTSDDVVSDESTVEDEEVPTEQAEAPKGNASLDAWTEYAKSQGATDEDLEGLKRNDIAAKYGTKE